MLGRHTIKHWSSTQASISLSSGEAEYYGVVRAAAQGIGARSLLVDLKSKMGEVDFEISASKSLHPEIVGKIRNHLKQVILRGIDYAKEFDDLCDTSDDCIMQADCKEVLINLCNSNGFLNLDSHRMLNH